MTRSQAGTWLGPFSRKVLVTAGIILLGSIWAVRMLLFDVPSKAPLHDDGPTATSSGGLVVDGNGVGYVCRLVPATRLVGYALGAEPPPACSGLRVSVVGAHPEDIYGLSTDGNLYWASAVELTGAWAGDTIEVQTAKVLSPLMRRPDPSAAPQTDVPCPTPAGGWKAKAGPLPTERALATIGAAIAADPTRFAGQWLGQSIEGVSVLVVAAVEPSADLRAELEMMYPHPLCVVPVTRSYRELETLATKVAEHNAAWETQIVVEMNVVRVYVALLDDPVRAAMAAYGSAVVIAPLVVIRESSQTNPRSS